MAIARAGEAHLEAIASIYAAAARTPATFDLEPKPVEWWREKLAETDPERGWLLLVALDGERVTGYAKSGIHREKLAYSSTVETSVYLDEQERGRGVGTALYAELLARLDGRGLRRAVGGVTLPNPASERLHLSLGFTEVGTFTQVGFKDGRGWDVRWYERPLRP